MVTYYSGNWDQLAWLRQITLSVIAKRAILPWTNFCQDIFKGITETNHSFLNEIPCTSPEPKTNHFSVQTKMRPPQRTRETLHRRCRSLAHNLGQSFWVTGIKAPGEPVSEDVSGRAVGNDHCDTTERASQRLFCQLKGGFPCITEVGRNRLIPQPCFQVFAPQKVGGLITILFGPSLDHG